MGNIEAAAQLLLQLAMEAGMYVTPDNRISLQDAAKLVGVSFGHMRNIVSDGSGPVVYRLGGRGHRCTVNLIDLAEWRESRRVASPGVIQRHR